MLDDYLDEVERSLTLSREERANKVAVLRAFLEDGQAEGTLESRLQALGTPQEAAAKLMSPQARHQHLDAVTFADGTTVWATSFRLDHDRDEPPTFGLYLDPRWTPPWPHQHLDWPDFGVPDRDALVAALRDVLARARSGERVEIGCLGAHGRTGTALACLAVLTGAAPTEAVDWVRSVYCDRAVETGEQRAFVEQLLP